VNNQTHWKPFIALAGLIGLLFVLGLSLMLWTSAHAGGVWWPVMWGMGLFWLFPAFGFAMMLLMMFFFFGIIGRQGGPPDKFWPITPEQSVSRCPSCDSPVQSDWRVCPYCGTHLRRS